MNELVFSIYSLYCGFSSFKVFSRRATPDTLIINAVISKRSKCGQITSCSEAYESISPPYCRVTEIIGMPCIMPESFIQDFSFICRVGFEKCKLNIPSGFKSKTNDPDSNSCKINYSGRSILPVKLCPKKGCRNEPHENSLQQKCLEKAYPPVSVLSVFPAELPVPEIFTFSKVTPCQVELISAGPRWQPVTSE